MNLRHFAPPVVYIDSPLSYMVPGGYEAMENGDVEEKDFKEVCSRNRGTAGLFF